MLVRLKLRTQRKTSSSSETVIEFFRKDQIMNDYKPIETHYNGYKFRSRLEARWAVFFDAAGIEYQYEPEGFERQSCLSDEKIFYLPDFYFPKFKTYAEVKGSDEALEQDQYKIAEMVDWDGPMAGGLIILGEIPNWQRIKWGNVPVFSFLYHDKGVIHELCLFAPSGGKIVISRNIFAWFNAEGDGDDGCDCASGLPKRTTTKQRMIEDVITSYLCIKNPGFVKLKEAYRLAFQARFEHGETPRVKEVNDGKVE